MSPLSLTASDREAAWRLLLAAYRSAEGLTDSGLELCRRRFAAADRELDLARLLARELTRRRAFDTECREVMLVLADERDEDGVAGRRGVVRCDCRLGEFVRDRYDWYLESFRDGSLSAAFVLARALLDGRLEDCELLKTVLPHCLSRASGRQWEAAGLRRDTALHYLAHNWLTEPPCDEGIAAVEAALRLSPDEADYLRYLAAAYRPGCQAHQRRIYHALFAACPDDRENTRFLGQAILDGRIESSQACAVLEAALAAGPAEPDAVRVSLACHAARQERDDEVALGWLREAAALSGCPPEVTRWLAVCEARLAPDDEASLGRLRALLFDEDAPPAWRREAGLGLCRALNAAGQLDGEALQRTWALLDEGQRPDWLALALAWRYASEGRTDAASVEVYRQAYAVESTPELGRLLSRAYLDDRVTPLRERMTHWRACLDRGEAEPEAVVALADAYLGEGNASEAAIYVVEQMPAELQPRLLDELSHHRFRRGDFASAEAMAAALARDCPDDPSAVLKLLVCRVRRALTQDRPLRDLDLSPADRFPEHHQVQSLAFIIRQAAGTQEGDLDLATRTLIQPSPALDAALAALRGDAPSVEGTPVAGHDDLWLLAAVDQLAGRVDQARERLRSAEDESLPSYERTLAARQACQEGRPGEACQMLLPMGNRRRPPWDRLHPLLVDLALRHAPASTLGHLTPFMDESQRFAAELRVIESLASRGDPAASERLEALDPSVDPETWQRLRKVLGVQRIRAGLEGGGVGDTEALLAALRQDEEESDGVHWLSSLAARARGERELAWEYAYRLSEEARARPGVARTLAAWFLDDGLVSRSESALAAAATASNDVELRLALITLNAQLGRAERVAALCSQVLDGMAQDDGRRDSVELVRAAFAQPLPELDTATLFADLGELRSRPLVARLRLLFAVVEALLRDGRAGAAERMLRERLDELRQTKLPSRSGPIVAELQNALAHACCLLGDYPAATAELRRIQAWPATVAHNLAVVAAAAGEHLQAAYSHEEAIDGWAAAPFEQVGEGYREAVLFGAHLQVAGLYREVERWEDELRHLEACTTIRPLDVTVQRASIHPLLVLGRGEAALHKSQWLLTQRPDDLDIQLEHAAVLASTSGAEAAVAHLTALVVKRPDAAEVVHEKRVELRDRLLEVAKQQGRDENFAGMFAVAREAEALAETNEDRVMALQHQVLALSRMGGEGGHTALFEQAHQKCGEALGLAEEGRARQTLVRMQEQLGRQLAQQLAGQAKELLLSRRAAWRTLVESLDATPRGAAEEAGKLAGAFDRVVEIYQRAQELGDEPLRQQMAAALAEAQQLAGECRELVQGLEGAG